MTQLWWHHINQLNQNSSISSVKLRLKSTRSHYKLLNHFTFVVLTCGDIWPSCGGAVDQSIKAITRAGGGDTPIPENLNKAASPDRHPSAALQHYINTAMKKHISLLCWGKVAGRERGVGESMSGPCLQCLFRAAKCTIWPLGHFRERLPRGPLDALPPRADRYVSVRVSASLVRHHSLLRGAFVLMAEASAAGKMKGSVPVWSFSVYL